MSESTAPTDPTSPATDRATDGRFAAGNKCGHGNPFARQCAALRAALLAAVTPEDITEIAHSLLLTARAGDVASARLVLQYVIGKPQPAVDPDTLDLQEMRQYLAEQLPGDLLERYQGSMPLHPFVDMWPFFMVARKEEALDVFEKAMDKVDRREQRREQRRQERAAQEAAPQPEAPPVVQAAPLPESEASAPPAARPNRPSTHGANGEPPAPPPSTHGANGGASSKRKNASPTVPLNAFARWLRAQQPRNGDNRSQ